MEKILILDFGGQYNQLIARRVREQHVYCELHPYDMPLDEIRRFAPIGIIFTGGPHSVYLPDAPKPDPGVFSLGVPILGICYGCQLLAQSLGGLVTAAQDASAREYGKTETVFDPGCTLFRGLPEKSITWMSHGDFMARVPEGFCRAAHSAACPTAAICDEERRFYGVQFHPEVNHTAFGREMLHNFLYIICGAHGDWTMADFKRRSVEELRERVGSGRVLLALSGGVDSSVLAALLSEAIGSRLTCVFVDHGLLRKDEGDEVEAAGKHCRVTRFTCKCKISTTDYEEEEIYLSMDFLTTDATTRTYTVQTGSTATAGEELPAGLAQALYEQRSQSLVSEVATVRLGASFPKLGDKLVETVGNATETLFLQSFVAQWNAYLWPLLVTNRNEMRTVFDTGGGSGA